MDQFSNNFFLIQLKITFMQLKWLGMCYGLFLFCNYEICLSALGCVYCFPKDAAVDLLQYIPQCL
jgi:hypothetical protein